MVYKARPDVMNSGFRFFEQHEILAITPLPARLFVIFLIKVITHYCFVGTISSPCIKWALDSVGSVAGTPRPHHSVHTATPTFVPIALSPIIVCKLRPNKTELTLRCQYRRLCHSLTTSRDAFHHGIRPFRTFLHDKKLTAFHHHLMFVQQDPISYSQI